MDLAMAIRVLLLLWPPLSPPAAAVPVLVVFAFRLRFRSEAEEEA